MPITWVGRSQFTLGALIALVVFFICIGCYMWGGATLSIVLGLIALLAIAYLIG